MMSAIGHSGFARIARALTAAAALGVLTAVVGAWGSTSEPARAAGAVARSPQFSRVTLARPDDPGAVLGAASGPARRPGGPAGAAGGAAGPVNPLRGVLAWLRGRAGVAQVAVYDRATGTLYRLTDGLATQYTASIVKADILAMWLRRYQHRPGIIPASLPFSIRYLMTNMITISDNVAATGLFYFGGGCRALTAFNTLIPTRRTTVGCQTPTYYGWGNTTTTAADQVAIVRAIAYPGRVLRADARGYAQQLMESVIPTQRWGISCGPWGTSCDPPDYATPVPGVTVALKNGWKFVPTCVAQDDTCPWQVNSIGSVRGDGRDYVIAVLTTNNPAGPGSYGFNYGITTIQGVSERVWANLAP